MSQHQGLWLSSTHLQRLGVEGRYACEISQNLVSLVSCLPCLSQHLASLLLQGLSQVLRLSVSVQTQHKVIWLR